MVEIETFLRNNFEIPETSCNHYVINIRIFNLKFS